VAFCSVSMWHYDINICTMMSPSMSVADINSTENEVSPANWSWLTASLTMNIFQTITSFDESFVPLEILRRALRDHAIFTEF
jgi:hypothetical protein